MTAARQPIITVFGSSVPEEGSPAYATAMRTGKVLAAGGYGIANGGYGGVMEASARGAKEAGGRTVGVVCSTWKSRPNKYIDDIERTGSLPERLERLIEIGRAGYVVLPGATGTLAELAMVWELMCKRLLPKRPLVCVGAFWRPLIEMMVSERPAGAAYVETVPSPDELARCFPARRDD